MLGKFMLPASSNFMNFRTDFKKQHLLRQNVVLCIFSPIRNYFYQITGKIHLESHWAFFCFFFLPWYLHCSPFDWTEGPEMMGSKSGHLIKHCWPRHFDKTFKHSSCHGNSFLAIMQRPIVPQVRMKNEWLPQKQLDAFPLISPLQICI